MQRYRTKRFFVGGRDLWSVYETESDRLVATYVNESAALSLTHLLNVASLSSSIIYFGAER